MEETKLIGDIKGLTIKTACDFVSELGDIRNYSHPDQLIKMAGLSLIENSSGKKKGQTTISKRGRSGLRKALYLAVFSLIRHNEEFKELHKYYTTRAQNQLKGKQSMMALARKLLRIIFACVTKGKAYDGKKMIKDIYRPEGFLATA
jgi:transposase